MRRLLSLCLLAIASNSVAEPPAVRLDSIAYDDLAAEISRLKGRVVLVDVWGEFCGPCKKKMPSVVALHTKHGRQGLAVVTVSVDPPDDSDARAAAKAFLAKHGATCRNVILSDSPTVWQAKWKAEAVPLVFLFDREGRLVQKWADKFEITEVEKRVAKLMADGP